MTDDELIDCVMCGLAGSYFGAVSTMTPVKDTIF